MNHILVAISLKPALAREKGSRVNAPELVKSSVFELRQKDIYRCM